MPLEAGTQLWPYEILSPIGAGGSPNTGSGDSKSAPCVYNGGRSTPALSPGTRLGSYEVTAQIGGPTQSRKADPEQTVPEIRSSLTPFTSINT